MLKFEGEFHRFLWHPLYDNDPSLWEPKRIVADAKRLHANVIHWHATGSSSRSNFVFYQSNVHRSFPLIGDRNLLAEMVDECHRNGIYLVAYMNVHWAPPAFYEEHPGWHQVGHDGKPVGLMYGRGGAMCTNIQTYRETWVRPIVEEVVSGYDIDGLFLDGPARKMDACYCDDCRRLFRESYGTEMPTEKDWADPNFRNFIRFNYDSETSFLEFVITTAKKIKPDLPVYKNGTVLRATWFNGISPQYNAKIADMIGAESFMYYIRPLDVPCWKASAVSKYVSSCSRGKPRVTFLCYGHKPWHASPVSRDQHQLNIAAAVSNGCYPFMAIEDFSTRDQRRYSAVADMYEFIERNQNAYAGAHSMANIGVVYSQLTSDFYERGQVAAAGGTHDYYSKSEQTYDEEFNGFYEALIHSGCAFDVICDEAITRKDLSRFDVIVLPNTACLTEDAIALLRDQVAAGKGLVASFHASFFDAEGRERQRPALADELGIAEVRGRMAPAVKDYMKVVAEHPVIGDIPLDTQVVMPAENLIVDPAHGADTLAYAMELLAYVYAPTGKMTDAAMIVANDTGGRCVYFAGLIGAHYWQYGIPDHQDLIVRAVQWVAPRIAARVIGSPNVEVTLYRKGPCRFVHLVNYTSYPRLPLQHIEKVRDLRIELRWDPKGPYRARSLRTGRDLPAERTSNGLRITLDEMKIYEVICVEPRT